MHPGIRVCLEILESSDDNLLIYYFKKAISSFCIYLMEQSLNLVEQMQRHKNIETFI